MGLSLVEDVIDRVADATGYDPGELPPLHDTIDPDVVEAIGECDAARLQIVYVDLTVTIEVRAPGDWRVTVDPASPKGATDR